MLLSPCFYFPGTIRNIKRCYITESNMLVFTASRKRNAVITTDSSLPYDAFVSSHQKIPHAVPHVLLLSAPCPANLTRWNSLTLPIFLATCLQRFPAAGYHSCIVDRLMEAEKIQNSFIYESYTPSSTGVNNITHSDSAG